MNVEDDKIRLLRRRPLRGQREPIAHGLNNIAILFQVYRRKRFLQGVVRLQTMRMDSGTSCKDYIIIELRLFVKGMVKISRQSGSFPIEKEKSIKASQLFDSSTTIVLDSMSEGRYQ